MPPRRFALIAIASIWVVMAARLAGVWGQLPARMATHFNGRGQADGWMSRDGFTLFWFGMQLGVLAVMWTIPLWLRPMPNHMINVPNRDYWLAPERRSQALARLGRWGAWFTVGLTALMAAVLEQVLRANLAPAPQLSGIYYLLVGFLVFVALMLWRLYTDFRAPVSPDR
jgi:serine/threonine-protein kinase